jgi:hypothetical protein
VRPDDGLSNRQAQASALCPACIKPSRTVEALEDVREVFFRNPDTLILENQLGKTADSL